MGRPKKVVETESVPKRKRAPARTPEARENQLISYAVDLVEQQLLDGTISNQILLHLVKRSSAKERIEEDILLKQKDFLSAKTEQIKQTANMEELYKDAIAAMKRYGGESDYE